MRVWGGFVSFAVLGLSVVSGSAGSKSMTRYLPDPVGFYSTGAGDALPGIDVRDAYNVVLRSGKREREATIIGFPSNKAEAEFLLNENARSLKAKEVVINGTNGIIYSQGSVTSIDWVVRSKVRVRVQAAGLNRSEILGLANSISTSTTNDGSFKLKRKPSGLSIIFTAWSSSFESGGYLATWQRSQEGSELALDVRPTVPNYLDVFCGPSNGRRLTSELIKGKPGCFEGGPLWEPGVFWMPESNVVIRLTFAEFGEAELLKLASTVVAVDEATYKQRTTPPQK
jgi:hypothetical protein